MALHGKQAGRGNLAPSLLPPVPAAGRNGGNNESNHRHGSRWFRPEHAGRLQHDGRRGPGRESRGLEGRELGARTQGLLSRLVLEPTQRSSGDGMKPAPGDVRDLLRLDHEAVLADLDALRGASDSRESLARLRLLRRKWVIHALAEETVVYNALEGLQGVSSSRAAERFVEHELVENLFEK